ncbi:cytochrome P450 [Auriculariales sp. MPI-PUGE-AT-0066]|nr:cytochrome P450 [Auriculariales sp. MPI-PUGE-AT-0066]
MTTDLLQLNTSLIAGIAVALAVLIRVLWNIKFSPLARQGIPGPTYAAVSDFWFQFQTIRFKRVFEIERLFKEYGPVVQVGPNRVAFLDTEPIHEIYRAFPFSKAKWWERGTIGGGQNSVITNDSVLHARLRRWHAAGFRGDSLRRTARLLVGQMNELVQRMHTLDMLGIALFDTKFEQIRTRQEHPAIQYNSDILVDQALRTSLPETIFSFIKLLPIRRLRQVFTADPGLFELGAKMYDELPDEPTDSEAINIMGAAKWSTDPATGKMTSRNQVLSEMAIFVIAGTDTTAFTITYLMYELALRPRLYDIIREELRQAENQDAIYDIQFLRSIPYLGAVLKEVLRVHGPASFYIERTVLPGGIRLGGHFIPEGVEVGFTAHATARNKHLFPNPELVDPERWIVQKDGRWIEREDVPLADMNTAWLPFGSGLRACAGRPLAEVEILLTWLQLWPTSELASTKAQPPSR